MVSAAAKPDRPGEVADIDAELDRGRVNIRHKALSRKTIAGADRTPGGSVLDALERVFQHNLREGDGDHRVPEGRIDRALSRHNVRLAGPATVAETMALVRDTLESEGIALPTKVDGAMAVEVIVFAGRLDHARFFPAALAWVRGDWPGCPVISAVAHGDESAWHVHVVLLPVLGGRLQGGTLSKGNNMFKRRNARFLAWATAQFGPVVLEGHSGRGIFTLGDSAAKSGAPRSLGPSEAKVPGTLTRENGDRSTKVPGTCRSQNGDLLDYPVVPLPFTSLGFELCGDNFEGSRRVPGDKRQPVSTAPIGGMPSLEAARADEGACFGVPTDEVHNRESPRQVVVTLQAELATLREELAAGQQVLGTARAEVGSLTAELMAVRSQVDQQVLRETRPALAPVRPMVTVNVDSEPGAEAEPVPIAAPAAPEPMTSASHEVDAGAGDRPALPAKPTDKLAARPGDDFYSATRAAKLAVRDAKDEQRRLNMLRLLSDGTVWAAHDLSRIGGRPVVLRVAQSLVEAGAVEAVEAQHPNGSTYTGWRLAAGAEVGSVPALAAA